MPMALVLLGEKRRVPAAKIPAHCEWSIATQRRARAELRRQIKLCPDFATDTRDADVILEQVWNAITGLGRPAKRKK
jgi:hypothetical protein